MEETLWLTQALYLHSKSHPPSQRTFHWTFVVFFFFSLTPSNSLSVVSKCVFSHIRPLYFPSFHLNFLLSSSPSRHSAWSPSLSLRLLLYFKPCFTLCPPPVNRLPSLPFSDFYLSHHTYILSVSLLVLQDDILSSSHFICHSSFPSHFFHTLHTS